MIPFAPRVHAIVSLLFAAVGMWLVVAPFTVGYQPQGQDWVTGTRNDLIVGAVLLVVSLAVLIIELTLAVRARLRAVAAAEPERAAPVEAPAMTVTPGS
ncbi:MULTISPECIES: hypothetical protein [unclassified Pseudonocardia]|uniref:hypothetical protein n=1 Tax=unclassified Pseudonocardia TaxID=2619320 RepID=UPI000963E6F1|nr:MULTISPECIES: hypothetical protein [unclassified Pseudonocardia]MBN9097946.1 SPW repeat protein [Pseudonocardia sp.]OJY49061.1 MAG: hypothetical protein BGP03_28785 [Pseudonocardia sp. 73-21]